MRWAHQEHWWHDLSFRLHASAHGVRGAELVCVPLVPPCLKTHSDFRAMCDMHGHNYWYPLPYPDGCHVCLRISLRGGACALGHPIPLIGVYPARASGQTAVGSSRGVPHPHLLGSRTCCNSYLRTRLHMRLSTRLHTCLGLRSHRSRPI